MTRLIAVSPVGKNGQTVVPASIRKMFKISEDHNLVGFFMNGTHIEIAPISVDKTPLEYSPDQLDKVQQLAKEKGGRKFSSPKDAKKFLNDV